MVRPLGREPRLRHRRGRAGARRLRVLARPPERRASPSTGSTRVQNEDGGFGEDLRSYRDDAWRGRGESTASQTAWALLALDAAGERWPRSSSAPSHWLVETQRDDGGWDEPYFTGTGFPGDFYLNYHLYRRRLPRAGARPGSRSGRCVTGFSCSLRSASSPSRSASGPAGRCCARAWARRVRASQPRAAWPSTAPRSRSSGCAPESRRSFDPATSSARPSFAAKARCRSTSRGARCSRRRSAGMGCARTWDRSCRSSGSQARANGARFATTACSPSTWNRRGSQRPRTDGRSRVLRVVVDSAERAPSRPAHARSRASARCATCAACREGARRMGRRDRAAQGAPRKPAVVLRRRRARDRDGRARARAARHAGLRPQADRPQRARRAELERRGAVFVEELDEVPEGATVVFSAHGVAPAVRVTAERGGSTSSTRRAHSSARSTPRHAISPPRGRRFFSSVTRATRRSRERIGEAPDAIRVVQNVDEAERSTRPTRARRVPDADHARGRRDERGRGRLRDGSRCSGRRTRTTSVTRPRTASSRCARSPADADAVLVVGLEDSSNSLRLVEVAQREGTRAYLVDDEADVDVAWLRDANTVGLTAGASAPEQLVDRLVAALAALGPVDVEERTTTTESVRFRIPREVRS